MDELLTYDKDTIDEYITKNLTTKESFDKTIKYFQEQYCKVNKEILILGETRNNILNILTPIQTKYVETFPATEIHMEQEKDEEIIDDKTKKPKKEKIVKEKIVKDKVIKDKVVEKVLDNKIVDNKIVENVEVDKPTIKKIAKPRTEKTTIKINTNVDEKIEEVKPEPKTDVKPKKITKKTT